MRPLVCALFCVLPASDLLAQQVGDLAIVKDRAAIRSGDQIVGTYARADSFIVQKVEGDQLWTSDTTWVDRVDVLSVEDALSHFSELIADDPKDAALYKARATVRLAKGNYTEAIDDLNEAIDLRPQYATAHFYRGTALAYLEKYEAAIDDLSMYVLLRPSTAAGYYNRGNIYRLTGNYEKAISDYENSIRLSPRHPWHCGNLAWLLATCPEARFRDGNRATSLATQACELSDWKHYGALCDLAAAYAENGDFAKAVEWQEKAIEISPEEKKQEFRSRLELFKSGKPYREAPKTTNQVQ